MVERRLDQRNLREELAAEEAAFRPGPPGTLEAPSAFPIVNRVLYGAFVSAHAARNGRNRRFSARAGSGGRAAAPGGGGRRAGGRRGAVGLTARVLQPKLCVACNCAPPHTRDARWGCMARRVVAMAASLAMAWARGQAAAERGPCR